ncbi:MAG: hypothetical protein U0T83_07355 [Bacteriovoracaceae bacterium]
MKFLVQMLKNNFIVVLLMISIQGAHAEDYFLESGIKNLFDENFDKMCDKNSSYNTILKTKFESSYIYANMFASFIIKKFPNDKEYALAYFYHDIQVEFMRIQRFCFVYWWNPTQLEKDKKNWDSYYFGLLTNPYKNLLKAMQGHVNFKPVMDKLDQISEDFFKKQNKTFSDIDFFDAYLKLGYEKHFETKFNNDPDYLKILKYIDETKIKIETLSKKIKGE